MRKSTRSLVLRVGCVVCVALAAAACSVLAAEEGAKSPADSILRDLARAHLGLKTYQARLVVHQELFLGEQKHSSDAALTVKAARPDRIQVRAELGSQKLLLVSNGREFAMHLDATNRYVLLPAPDSVDAILAHPVLERLLLGMPGIILGPLGDEPYKALTAGVTASELVPPAKEDPPGTDHVLLRRGEGDVHVWISREPRRLVRAELDPEALLGPMKAGNAEMKDAKAVLRVQPEDVRVDAEIPAETFDFKAPEGAERVQDWTDVFRPARVSQVGKPMKDFTLEGLTEGTSWRLADHKGKVIVLDFWATWCEPCREDLPQLQKIWDDYGKKGDFLLLGVNVGEQRETVTAFVEQTKLTIPVALDPEGKVASEYSVSGFPTVLLIGRDGLIRTVHEGYAPDIEQTLRAEIDKLLAEKPAEAK